MIASRSSCHTAVMNLDPEHPPTRSRRPAQRIVARVLLATAAITAVTVTPSAVAAITPLTRDVDSSLGSLSTVALVPAQGALLGHYYGNGTIRQTDQRI